VVDGKDGVSASLSLFKPELSLGEKAMEVIPRNITSGNQFGYAWSNLPPHERLERFLILVMFKLCSGSGRLLSRTSRSITFAS
jgi:hypothetical protein